MQRRSFWRFLGVAGFFAWLAIALYNVTQDSFATPNIWLIPGILAGVVGGASPVAAPQSPQGDPAGALDSKTNTEIV